MAADRLQLLERIRKLRDRARRRDGAEADSARHLARVLMRQHGITAADLELGQRAHLHLERAPTTPAGEKGPIPAGPPATIPVRVKIGGFEIRFRL